MKKYVIAGLIVVAALVLLCSDGFKGGFGAGFGLKLGSTVYNVGGQIQFGKQEVPQFEVKTL